MDKYLIVKYTYEILIPFIWISALIYMCYDSIKNHTINANMTIAAMASANLITGIIFTTLRMLDFIFKK